jgi:hypothetical protein
MSVPAATVGWTRKFVLFMHNAGYGKDFHGKWEKGAK